MSHSTVLVIGEPVEDLLAPYDENMSVEPYWEVRYQSPGDCVSVAAMIAKGELPANPSMGMVFAKLAAGVDAAGNQLDAYGDIIRYNDGVIESRSSYNPKSRWDWYAIGGRWRGSLLLKEPTPDAVLTEPHWTETFGGDPPLKLPPNACDQARKGDLDIEGMRARSADAAVVSWDQFKKIEACFGPLPAWSSMKDQGDIKAARDTYWAHPGIQALREAQLTGMLTTWEEIFGGHTRESFVALARAHALPGYATLKASEGWLEPGRMGMFGMSDETPDTMADYLAKANAIIDAASDDTLFTLVDVHI